MVDHSLSELAATVSALMPVVDWGSGPKVAGMQESPHQEDRPCSPGLRQSHIPRDSVVGVSGFKRGLVCLLCCGLCLWCMCAGCVPKEERRWEAQDNLDGEGGGVDIKYLDLDLDRGERE